jgi:hypothetical protein
MDIAQSLFGKRRLGQAACSRATLPWPPSAQMLTMARAPDGMAPAP